jgi:predicted RNase H-like HicB family nuclease
MQQELIENYPVKYEQGADGGWGAYVPTLPGVGVSAETREEVEQLIGEAIRLHLKEMWENVKELHHLRDVAALVKAAAAMPRKDGAFLIASERVRQVTEEKWMPEHDDEHDLGQLLSAAVGYVDVADAQVSGDVTPGDLDVPFDWPWDRASWKPSPDPIRNLTKAGALIAAEIDRLQRAAAKKIEASAQ